MDWEQILSDSIELAQNAAAADFKDRNPDYNPSSENFRKLEDARKRYGYPFSADGLNFAWQRVKDEELVGRVTDPWRLSQVEMLAKQAREAEAQREAERLVQSKWNRQQAIQDFYNLQQQMNLAQQQAAAQSAINQQLPKSFDQYYQQAVNDLYNEIRKQGLFSKRQQPPVDWQRQDQQELREHVAKSSTMQFGKHKGMELRDVPADYLEWSISTMEADVKRYRDELARREAVENSSVDIITQLLKAGFKELAKKAHPDTGGSQEQFLALKGAFETLKIAAEAIKETKCTT